MKADKRWKPKFNEKFWSFFIGEQSSVGWRYFSGHEFDKRYVRIGNCFRTRKEAIAMLRRIDKLLKGK